MKIWLKKNFKNGLTKLKNSKMIALLILTILIIGMLVYFAIDRLVIELKYMNILKEKELEILRNKSL